MKHETPLTIDRLGKRELGRHAFEERMPACLANIISDEGDENAVPGIIPNLAVLLKKDSAVETGYLCTRHAVQIHKLYHEGADFCGYRNIQMLCLAMGLSGFQTGGAIDLRRKASIPKLQDLIEQAWDRDINSHGKIQTGGIKGTRKHVGTSEAEALMLELGIPCTGTAFNGNKAWLRLLNLVENYFANSIAGCRSRGRVAMTSRPPIFLQRPGHSVVIVGIVKLKSGKRRILIFDPAWKPPARILEASPEGTKLSWKELLDLRRYSKSERWLQRFSAFETLTIDMASLPETQFHQGRALNIGVDANG